MVKCFGHAREVNNKLEVYIRQGIVSSCAPTKSHHVVRKKSQVLLSHMVLKEMYTCMKFGIQGLSASHGHCLCWKRSPESLGSYPVLYNPWKLDFNIATFVNQTSC